jgi:hypothetical protein
MVLYLSTSCFSRFTSSSSDNISTSRAEFLNSWLLLGLSFSDSTNGSSGVLGEEAITASLVLVDKYRSDGDVGGHETLLSLPGVCGMDKGVSAWVQ